MLGKHQHWRQIRKEIPTKSQEIVTEAEENAAKENKNMRFTTCVRKSKVRRGPLGGAFLLKFKYLAHGTGLATRTWPMFAE